MVSGDFSHGPQQKNTGVLDGLNENAWVDQNNNKIHKMKLQIK